MESQTQLNRQAERLTNQAFNTMIRLPKYGDLVNWVSPRSTTTCQSSCSPAVPAVVDNKRQFECTVNLAEVNHGYINERVIAF